MREAVEFNVDGLPKGQPRPRAFARKVGDRVVARVHDSGSAEGWKSDVARASMPHRPAAPLDGPIVIAMGVPHCRGRSR
jgi:Holliday junction resolvase RusA-like endonuclease